MSTCFAELTAELCGEDAGESARHTIRGGVISRSASAIDDSKITSKKKMIVVKMTTYQAHGTQIL